VVDNNHFNSLRTECDNVFLGTGDKRIAGLATLPPSKGHNHCLLMFIFVSVRQHLIGKLLYHFRQSTAMTHSTPHIFRLILIAVWLLLITGLFCIAVVEWATESIGLNIFIQTFLTVMTILAGLLFMLLELPRILAMTIDNNKIVVKNLLTRQAKHFLFETIDCFKISSQFGLRSGFHFELIQLKDDKLYESISLRYIHNLDQIIKELENRLQNVTEDEYGFLRHIRDQAHN
jgi:hypothetical protein